MLGLHLIKIFPHCQKEKKKHKKQAKEKETTKVSKAMKMLCLMKKKENSPCKEFPLFGVDPNGRCTQALTLEKITNLSQDLHRGCQIYKVE